MHSPKHSLFLVSFLAVMLWHGVFGLHAEEGKVITQSPFEVVTVVTRDDQGKDLGFPSQVFYSPAMREVYLLDGRRQLIIVYNENFLPIASLGKGRGISMPQDFHVGDDGTLYIIQGVTREAGPRLTIMNAAFLPEKEISLQDIGGVSGFIPRKIALSAEGLIYITGRGTESGAVLVLDNEGNFLRWLEHRELTVVKETVEDAPQGGNLADLQRALGAETAPQAAQESQPSQEEPVEEEEIIGALPEAFRPKAKGETQERVTRKMMPVAIDDVNIDQRGYIYLLSVDKGKIYVYNDQEEFLFSFGTKGGSSGKLARPYGVAVDDTNKAIYVVDYMRHTVLAYNSKGTFMFEFGGRGMSPGWFNFPSGISTGPENTILVTDPFNKRMQVLHIEFAVSTERYDEKTTVRDAEAEAVEPEPALQTDQNTKTDEQQGQPGGAL